MPSDLCTALSTAVLDRVTKTMSGSLIHSLKPKYGSEDVKKLRILANSDSVLIIIIIMLLLVVVVISIV